MLRFDYEIEIPVPDADARIDILQRLLMSYKHDVSNDVINKLGSTGSHGFVGSDISLAVSLANTKALNNFKYEAAKDSDSNENACPIIRDEHLMWAFAQIKPSAMREILVEVPNVGVNGEENFFFKELMLLS